MVRLDANTLACDVIWKRMCSYAAVTGVDERRNMRPHSVHLRPSFRLSRHIKQLISHITSLHSSHP